MKRKRLSWRAIWRDYGAEFDRIYPEGVGAEKQQWKQLRRTKAISREMRAFRRVVNAHVARLMEETR